MLQQTQVKTVLPRYAAWFERFPTIQSLADASLDDVLKAWEGLGYYRRARFLHAAANQMVQDHAAVFPHDFDAMLKLAGIGRSTAGAISSFCFQMRKPVLDGNVKRVLKRWCHQDDLKEKTLWPLAQSAIDKAEDVAIWNQSMMELGARICLPHQPNCQACPVSDGCLSAFQVCETAPEKRIRVKNLYWKVLVHRHPDKGIWLRQRPEQGIWAGLWTPPLVELDEQPEEKADYVHLLTHRRLHLYAELVDVCHETEGAWFSSLDQVALPTGIHRLLACLD